MASENWNSGPPFKPVKVWPSSSNATVRHAARLLAVDFLAFLAVAQDLADLRIGENPRINRAAASAWPLNHKHGVIFWMLCMMSPPARAA
jgi:hypothetical protein